MLIARAVYDNEAETPEELSFDREDILAVLEEDYNGMEGWCLCSLRGKTGIAPANRLQVIHKIDVRSPSAAASAAGAAVKGPTTRKTRLTSTESRPTDYDFPKPLVPRKIGGSIDNLLDIAEDDSSYRGGVGGGCGGGGWTPSGRRGQGHEACSVAGKRGVSVDNLSMSSHFTEYAVPISLSSADDYEVPRKDYGRKASNNLIDKFSSGKGGMMSGMSSKDGQRHKNTRRPSETCETPTGPPDRHPKNLPVPELKLWDRDSCLADYDTPTSSANATPLDGKGTKHVMSKSQVVQQPARRSPPKTQDKSSSKTQKCEVDPAFLASLSEVQSAVMQITSYADKWRACPNPSMKLSIVKQVCVAVWKKLQGLIVEFSKCLAKFRIRALAPLADRLGAIKVVTAELEKILNYISSCHPNDVHQGCIDYISELVIIAKEIECHLDYCSSFLSNDFSDLLTGSNKTSTTVVTSPRFSNSDDMEADRRQKQQQRRAPALPPPRVILKTSDNNYSEDDFSISSVKYNTKTPTYDRSFSFDQLSCSDYDIPKSRPTELESKANRGSGKVASVIRSSGARSADLGGSKRNAVVVEKSQEAFNILQRRNSNSPVAPAKFITGKTNPEPSGKDGGRLNSSNTAEYDYPAGNDGTTEVVPCIQNTRDQSREHEEPITANDKRMLVFYGEQLNAELRQLSGSCQAVCSHPARASGEPKALLSAQIQTLVISAHKLVFVADTLIKKLAGVALKKQLQKQAMEIIDKTKSIAMLAKSSSNQGRDSNRQQFVEVTEKLLAAARTFQGIVMNGRS